MQLLRAERVFATVCDVQKSILVFMFLVYRTHGSTKYENIISTRNP